MLDNLKLFIDLLQGLAVVATCVMAMLAIRMWRKQHAGKSHFKLAEQALAAFFEVKDTMALIRNPFQGSEEGQLRQRSEHEAPEERQLLDRGYIVASRYEKNHAVFVRLQLLKYRCMAAFGVHVEPAFLSCEQLVHEVYTAAKRLANFYRPGHARMDANEFAQHLDDMHKRQGLFWDAMQDKDDIRKRLQAAQDLLERVMQPHLKI